MKPFLTVATRIARRLARKLAKRGALWLIERQLRGSEARAQRVITARDVTMPMARYERKRQVEMIGRRNQIREW
jgi:hypothetical protein